MARARVAGRFDSLSHALCEAADPERGDGPLVAAEGGTLLPRTLAPLPPPPSRPPAPARPLVAVGERPDASAGRRRRPVVPGGIGEEEAGETAAEEAAETAAARTTRIEEEAAETTAEEAAETAAARTTRVEEEAAETTAEDAVETAAARTTEGGTTLGSEGDETRRGMSDEEDNDADEGEDDGRARDARPHGGSPRSAIIATATPSRARPLGRRDVGGDGGGAAAGTRHGGNDGGDGRGGGSAAFVGRGEARWRRYLALGRFLGLALYHGQVDYFRLDEITLDYIRLHYSAAASSGSRFLGLAHDAVVNFDFSR